MPDDHAALYAVGTDFKPTAGHLLEEVRRAMSRLPEGGSLIGVSGAGEIRALTNAVQALTALIETHHSRMRIIELRQHGVSEKDIW